MGIGSSGTPATNSYPKWAKNASAVLTASQAWESACVAEPNVIRLADGTYRMFYTGGFSSQAIGTATSSNGTTWSKYASNPIVGQGNGSVAGSCGRSFAMLVGSTFHLYFDLNSGTTIKHTTSTDGTTWASPTDVFSLPFGTIFGNVSIVIDGSTWHMIYEVLQTVWKLGYATSTDGTTWTNQAGPLTTLQISSGSYGGPHLQKTGSGWELYYHASTSSTLPTDIYYATSTDLTTWTKGTTPSPLVARSLSFEVDQVADPFVTTIGADLTMYYAGMDNNSSAGRIGYAVRR